MDIKEIKSRLSILFARAGVPMKPPMRGLMTRISLTPAKPVTSPATLRPCTYSTRSRRCVVPAFR